MRDDLSTDFAGSRLLLVDDDTVLREMATKTLRHAGFDVVPASTGREALRLFTENHFDLVLLDVMMPGMDGFEVCAKIKENPATAHVPVVMVTALTDTQDKVRGLEAGADDFLSKPINDTALMARVRSLVRLKMSTDEWRIRENTANQLGVVEEASSVRTQSAENANILIIEDQDFELKKMSETLLVDHDTVRGAVSGAEALELTRSHDFELLIVSLNLKEEDGLRLCSHLKSNETTRAVPLVMVGGADDMDRMAPVL